MRKESSWHLGSSTADTNKSLGTTPKKGRGKGTPGKGRGKKAAANESAEGDDDSELEMATPSKKGSPMKKENMNKVKNGRVEKKVTTPSRAAKSNIKSYVDSDDEGDDDEAIIKDEDMNDLDFGRAADGDEDMLGGGGFMIHGRSNTHHNGNGHGSSFAEEEIEYYDAEA